MPYFRVILLMGLAPLVLSATASAQSRPADTQGAASTVPVTASHPDSLTVPIPITFARSGRQAEAMLLPVLGGRGRIEEEVVMTAFGRVWFGPTDVVQTSAVTRTMMTVPNVRVPTMFSIVDRGKRIVGELVAYPDRDVEWDKKITLYSCGAPEWFDQWASATGLLVKQIAAADLASAKLPPSDDKGKRLLILGHATAGNYLPVVTKIANDMKVNVLVLGAHWFGDAAGPVSVAPAQMLGGLAEVAKQHWPQPLKFASHRRPWSGIANRWAWVLDQNGLPLVEEICPLSSEELRLLPAGESPTYEKQPQFEMLTRILVSNIPWQEQLGRSESADASFLALLSAAAATKARECQWHPVGFVNQAWPEPKDCACPVLLAVRSGGFWRRQDFPDAKPDYVAPIYVILDLRGEDRPPSGEDLSKQCKQSLEGQPLVVLLILGDDKLLDEWEWLKLDRAKKTIHRPGVVWLSDDELPPSKDNQIKLMLKLTELGVPLAPPSQEEKKQ